MTARGSCSTRGNWYTLLGLKRVLCSVMQCVQPCAIRVSTGQSSTFSAGAWAWKHVEEQVGQGTRTEQGPRGLDSDNGKRDAGEGTLDWTMRGATLVHGHRTHQNW